MATITFKSVLQEGGAIVIPKEALERLGLLMGEEVEVQVANPVEIETHPVMLNESLRDLLGEIETLEPDAKTVCAAPAEKAYGEVLLEKYRRMG